MEPDMNLINRHQIKKMTFEQLCKSHFLTVSDIVEATGIPRGTINTLVLGEKDLSNTYGRTLFALSRVFGMSMEELLFTVIPIPEEERTRIRPPREDSVEGGEVEVTSDGEVKRKRAKRKPLIRQGPDFYPNATSVIDKHITVLTELRNSSKASRRSKSVRDALSAGIEALKQVKDEWVRKLMIQKYENTGGTDFGKV